MKDAWDLLMLLAAKDVNKPDQDSQAAVHLENMWQAENLEETMGLNKAYLAPALTADPVRWWKKYGDLGNRSTDLLKVYDSYGGAELCFHQRFIKSISLWCLFAGCGHQGAGHSANVCCQ